MKETKINAYGETVTRWESHKHPDNPDFSQVVFWTVWERPCKPDLVGWHLGSGSKTKFIYGSSLQEAISKYTDLL